MRYPAYPSYKPSGVDWLGDVPENWSLTRIKHLGLIRYGLGEPPEYVDDGLPFIRATDIKRGKIDLELVKKVSPNDVPWSRNPQLKPNEVLVVRSGAYTGDSAIVTSEIAGCIAGYDMVLSVRTAHPPFVAWALLSKYLLQGQIYLERLRAAQPHLNAEELGGFIVLLPPISEQRTIADFLDHETVKIDTLVAKKRELIEKLKEQRTALISQSVTHGLPPDAARTAGLDPHPKLKPSGIEWLGEVPEHWEVKRLRHLVARLDQGWSPNADSSPAEGDQWGVLKLNAARDGRFEPSENKALDDLPDGIALVTPEEGDVLVSRSNTPERVGDACLVLQDYPRLIVPDLIYRVKLRPGIASPAYVCAFLLSRSGRAQIEADARGSSGSMVKLGQGHLLSWLIPCPPLPEQCAIADYLDREATKIDRMVEKVEEAIEKLQEYRTALITTAVTGKIDVQGAKG